MEDETPEPQKTRIKRLVINLNLQKDAKDTTSAQPNKNGKDTASGSQAKWLDFFLTRFIPAGVFTGLLYFLGRLRVEAYYTHLGIDPRSLSFTFSDYMFFSFDPLVILLITVIYLSGSYRLVKLLVPNKYFSGKKHDWGIEAKRRLLTSIVLLGILGSVMFFYSTDDTGFIPYWKGGSALFIGCALGLMYLAALLFFLSLDWINTSLSLELKKIPVPQKLISFWKNIKRIKGSLIAMFTPAKGEPNKVEAIAKSVIKAMETEAAEEVKGEENKITIRRIALALMVFAGLGTIAYLPSFTDTLAAQEAKTNLKNLPYVSLSTNSSLPEKLQLSADKSNQSIMVQLLTVNNGTTYLYLLNTSNKSKEYWEIITVPSNQIKTIIYYDPKLQEEKP